MAKEADAEFFRTVAGAVGTIGGSAIKGGVFAGNSGTTPLKVPEYGTYDWNTELDIGGMGPGEFFQKDIGYSIFGN